MRRLLLTVIAVCLLSLGWSAFAVPARSVRYSIDGIRIAGEGDVLSVSVTWSFEGWNVADGKAIVYSLSLKHGDYSCGLRPVVVYGRKAARQASELVASGRSDELAVVDLSSKQTFTVTEEIAYREWMDTVKVLLSVSEWSKGPGLVLRSSAQKGCYAKPAMPPAFDFEPAYLEPERFIGTYRKADISVPVLFDGDSQVFDLAYSENSSSMARLVPFLRSVTSSGRFSLSGSELSLTIAPGGSGKTLQKRSKARLQSLYQFLQKKGAFLSSSKPSLVSGDEDWDGVRAWVERSRYGSDARLMEILSMDPESADIGSLVSREKPAVWDVLVKDCFPYRGSVRFSFSYKPLAFSSPSAVAPVFNEIPEVLSPWDFWYLSTLFSEGSPEWLEVIVKGAELNSDSVELNYDAGMGLCLSGAPMRATEFLRHCGDDIKYKYLYVVWLYKLRRFDECAELLDYLAEHGSFYESVYENAIPFIDWVTNYVDWQEVHI